MTTKKATIEIGTLQIISQKEVKGYGSENNLYLWAFSDIFSKKKPEWVAICDVSEYSEDFYQKIKAQRTSSFSVIEFEGVKYIAFSFFGVKYLADGKMTILEEKKADNSPLTVDFQIETGDELILHEFGSIAKWVSSTNHTMKVTGQFTENMDSCSSYEVQSEAIIVPEGSYEDAFYKINDKPVHIIRTCTDIGGHYLSVCRNKEEVYKVHLHNGFGDGNYRLKFQNGLLIR
jgi:hypothetical protein